MEGTTLLIPSRALAVGGLSLTWLLCLGGMAAGYDQVVVFGDSLSDPGNAFALVHTVARPPYALIPDFPYARGGHHFSNGATWVEQLANALGVARSAGPAWRVPGTFTNYAVGGARARLGEPTDLAGQRNRFLADVGPAAPTEALYVVHIGGNDLRDALEALERDPSGDTSALILGQALAAIASTLTQLASAGARTFLVPNAPDLALVPAVRLSPDPVPELGRALAMIFNAGLEAILDALAADPELKIFRIDVFGLLGELVTTPAAFGLADVDDTCVRPFTRVEPFCPRPDAYLFWDGIHPTRAGHAILARRALEVLTAP